MKRENGVYIVMGRMFITIFASVILTANLANAQTNENRQKIKDLISQLDGANDYDLTKDAVKIFKTEFLAASGSPENEIAFDLQLINTFMKFASQISSEDAIKQLTKDALNDLKSPLNRFRFYAIVALGFHQKHDIVLEDYDKILKKSDGIYHSAVALSILQKPTTKSIPVLFKLLEDTYSWESKQTALECLDKIKDDSTVDGLIQLLGNSTITLKVKYKLVQALKNITGIDLDTDSAIQWQNAWKRTSNGLGDGSQNTSVQTKFFGLNIQSDRFVFLLDQSGSMMTPASGNKSDYEPMPKTISTGKSDDALPNGLEVSKAEQKYYKACVDIYNEWAEIEPKTKFELLKKEMVRTLLNMSADILFNIVWYSDSYSAWQNTLVQANWKTKLDAMNHVTSAQIAGNTNISDPLIYSYKIKNRKKVGEKPFLYYDERSDPYDITDSIDTIIVLTDGIPNRGVYPQPNDILKYTQLMKGFRPVTINVIGLGEAVLVPFLRALAENNFGTAKFIR